MTRGVAPEKLWAGPSEDDKGVFWDVGHWDADYDENCIEYIRADIVTLMLDVMVCRIKLHEDMSRLTGSMTSVKREKTRVHALSEALGEMRNVLKETNK
jgi:hypothetical protein